ncbi:hypothetical protein Q8A67_012535 [Cirrhinus molitorella]|uniref:AIG1-type G domain-containing protein n=1 Tax=Cirrhinus molitorella TaxID=172907 RepID=A0AA88TMH0_9TELE|nr:hypothetical protein Q8A67_012535 [Cirrhinus molitorella]
MDHWSRPSKQSVVVTKQERRIILLGSHKDVKAACGNTILEQQVFSESPSSQHMFDKNVGLKGRLMVINTPDLLDLALFSEENNVRKFFHLSYPGPHSLLLVLKPGTYTEQDKDALKLIDVLFGAGASEYVLVVFMCENQMEYASIKEVESLLLSCRQPHHYLLKKGGQRQVQKLLESIEKMLEENGGHYLKNPEESYVTRKMDIIRRTSKESLLNMQIAIAVSSDATEKNFQTSEDLFTDDDIMIESHCSLKLQSLAFGKGMNLG